MLIEEKARAYDRVSKEVKDFFEGKQKMYSDVSQTLEYLFPELKEPEDEKIRKTIIRFFKDQYSNETEMYDGSVTVGKAIAWLEKQGEQKNKINSCKFTCEDILALECSMKTAKITKGGDELYKILVPLYNKIHNAYLDGLQGEQKPVDKVEPKFHEGEWVIDKQGMVHQIANVVENVTNHTYGYDIVGGGYFNDNTEGVRLWTIQDAKDGDVLVSRYNKPFIYNGNRDSFHISSYCGISVEDGFKVATEKCHWTENVNIYPATKEQRDLLFSKMKEKGYEWDAEKKKLSRRVIDEGKAEMDYCFTKMMNGEKVSPIWSEEDERAIGIIKIALEHPYDMEGKWDRKFALDWLKSLKNRVQPQPKQEWSEEDERLCSCIIEEQEESLDNVKNDKYGHSEIISDLKEMYRERIDWLKSLKQRIGGGL